MDLGNIAAMSSCFGGDCAPGSIGGGGRFAESLMTNITAAFNNGVEMLDKASQLNMGSLEKGGAIHM